MKKLIIKAVLCIVLGVIIVIALSLLGYFNIWKFSNSIKTNIFVVGVVFLIIAFFSYQTTNEFDRKLTVFTSVTKYAKPDYIGFNNKLINLFVFVGFGILFGVLYLVFPEIKIQ